MIDIQSYTQLFAAQISFSQQALESLGTMWCIYGSLQDAKNAWDFSMAFNYVGFGYLVPHEENSYFGSFIEWHKKSCLAIKEAEHNGLHVGVYPSKSGSNEASTLEYIFDFISEKIKEWTLRVRHNGVDVWEKHKVLMGEAIPKLAG